MLAAACAIAKLTTGRMPVSGETARILLRVPVNRLKLWATSRAAIRRLECPAPASVRLPTCNHDFPNERNRHDDHSNGPAEAAREPGFGDAHGSFSTGRSGNLH